MCDGMKFVATKYTHTIVYAKGQRTMPFVAGEKILKLIDVIE